MHHGVTFLKVKWKWNQLLSQKRDEAKASEVKGQIEQILYVFSCLCFLFGFVICRFLGNFNCFIVLRVTSINQELFDCGRQLPMAHSVNCSCLVLL